MSELWIRNPGAKDEYGPVTLAGLRNLVRVGLILEDTRVSDGRGDGRRIAAWPELVSALADESATTWAGAPEKPRVNRAARVVPIAATPDEIRMEEAAVLSLNRAGRDYEKLNDTEECMSVREVLANNVRRELFYVPETPPWYRYPVARNAFRWLAFVGPVSIFYGIAVAAGAVKIGYGMQMEDAGLLTLLMGMITIWSWQVWIIEPCRWRMLKPGSSSEYLEGCR